MRPARGFAAVFFLLGFVVISGLVLAFYLNKLGTFIQTKGLASPRPSSIPSKNPQATDETANWKTYTNQRFGYSLKYPPDVNLELTTKNDLSDALIFQANNFKIIHFKGPGTAAETTIEQYLKDAHPANLNPSYDNIMTTSTQKYLGSIKIIITSKDTKFEHDQRHAWFIRNKTLYSFITYAEGSDNPKVTDEQDKLFNQILSTIRFTE